MPSIFPSQVSLSRDFGFLSAPMSTPWQEAWDLAQPRLQAIRQSLPTFPHPSPRVLRVGQLDAELLDQELLQILTDPLTKAIGLIQVCIRLLRCEIVSQSILLVFVSIAIRPRINAPSSYHSLQVFCVGHWRNLWC